MLSRWPCLAVATVLAIPGQFLPEPGANVHRPSWRDVAEDVPNMVHVQQARPQLNLCVHGRLVSELFVLGAQKAGTTSFCSELTASRQVLQPHPRPVSHSVFASWKEPHIFDSRVVSFDPRSTRWLSRFPNCTWDERVVVLDCSSYLHKGNVAQNLHQWYGQRSSALRFIILLREPISRMHSAFRHELRILRELRRESRNNSFPAYVERVVKNPSDDFFIEGRPFTHSCYATQIKTYFLHFRTSQSLSCAACVILFLAVSFTSNHIAAKYL
eukprot:TRINITY_DN48946_c0_g1_i1.p1 TRINITY_DN48946_c0_g1~~TRINITY_DN48946_c0_g1_i1.p1  ORF type:complete len:271 (-),score=30.48 TRINITY_DN48946_c0_g1_i1:285-1097(-)